jgi:hypothetical protein
LLNALGGRFHLESVRDIRRDNSGGSAEGLISR